MAEGSAYRRGTVAGLSLGEVFILLSFVLMMAVLLISEEARHEGPLGHTGVVHARSESPPDPEEQQALSDEAEKTQRQLTRTTEHLKQAMEANRVLAERLERETVKRRQAEADADGALRQVTEVETARKEALADEIEAHVETKAALARAEEENAKLAEKREADEAEISTRIAQIQDTEDALVSAKVEIAALKTKVDEVQTEVAAQRQKAEEHLSWGKDVTATAAKQIVELRDQLKAAGAEADRDTRKAREAHAEMEEALAQQKEEMRKEREKRLAAEARATKAEMALAAKGLSKDEKGVNPPCWYVRVPDTHGEGSREKALYVLDIRVTDTIIEFGNRGLPQGKPDQGENGDYMAEAKSLGLPDLPYGAPLSDKQASRLLQKLYRAGRDGEVRSYPCTFYAQVWDHTNRQSKTRWQNIMESVIGSYVQPYRVKEDAWPH